MSGNEDMQAAWQVGVFDAHCHPTDIVDSIDRIGEMKARVLTVMSTRSQDQELVFQAAEKYPCHSKETLGQSDMRGVIPAFGWHPWFSHQLYDDRQPNESVDAMEHYRAVLTPASKDEDFLRTLQPPIALSKFLRDTEERLQQFPLALVGEIGLDRGFRLPEGPSSITGDVSRKTGGDEGAYTPGSREGRPLTSYKVNLEHQKRILRAQLELAAKHKRPVSVHSVQAHGVVFEVLRSLWKGHERPSKRAQKKKLQDAEGAFDPETKDIDDTRKDAPAPYPPRICMHSYSGPKDALQWFTDPKVPADVYFSFSECINFSNSSSDKVVEVIKSVPENRILIESDLHCAGERMDGLLQDIVKRVCNLRGWQIEEGAKILRSNWERFIFGD